MTNSKDKCIVFSDVYRAQRRLTSKGCKWLLVEAALLKTACIQRTNASVPCNQIQLSMRASKAWRSATLLTLLGDDQDSIACEQRVMHIVIAKKYCAFIMWLGVRTLIKGSLPFLWSPAGRMRNDNNSNVELQCASNNY